MLSPARLILSLVLFYSPAYGAEVSFRNEVMAVLSKAGCNAGTCHGNKNGKGGFKLSLRGQDPAHDHLSLTRDLVGRRVNVVHPEQSLILLKPTAELPHEGGSRFRKSSQEYQILQQWLADGMTNDLAAAPKLERIEVTPREKVLVEPDHQVQVQVLAAFSDGTKRDVTSLAVYDPANALAKVSHDGLIQSQGGGEVTVLVRYLHCQEPVSLAFVPARPNFVWAAPPTHNYIDEHIFGKLRILRMNPSPLCADEVFLRRAYLDLLGILPTAKEARDFLTDPAPAPEAGSKRWASSLPASDQGTDQGKRRLHQRARLIDELLERPEFADFWALKWGDLLRAEAHSLDQKGVQNFHHWIRESIADNKPLDKFVRELITARGSTYLNPAANYYRPHREPAARAKAAAQVFLGTRLQCAECHNHPSDRWTQDDYHDWAGLFARVNYKIIENKRQIASDEHEWKGEQIVFFAREGSVKNPRTGREVQPRFLGATEVTPERDNLEALADWLTGPNNQLFARVQANRVWFHLMGRGLVDPPDDFRATNPASHPGLIEALGEDFGAHQFDVRYLIRLIMNSRAYQLASEPNDTNQGDQINYAYVGARRLGAEQLLDSQSQVAGAPLRFSGYPRGLRAAQLPGVRPESKGQRRANQLDLFLEMFGKPPRLLTTDTERSCECNMGQAFQLLSGPALNELLGEKENRISQLLANARSNLENLQELFWTALTRSPTPVEIERLLPSLEPAKNSRAEWEDLLWGLLNSKEFLFRH